MTVITVPDAVERFLAAERPNVAAATFALYRHYLRRFAAAFAGVGLGDVTPADVRQWDRRYHPIQCVQRLTSWCHREARLIESNPLEGMRKPRRGRRLRTLDRKETVRLMRSARPHFRRLLIALRESIARPHEWRRATFRNVFTAGLQPFTAADLAEGRCFVFLDQFKSQALRRDSFAVRVIPISARLGRLLVRVWNQSLDLDSPILRNRFGRAWTVNAVRCSFRRLRARAGFAADFRGENVVAYSLRHSAATAAAVAGVDLGTLSAVMGHSDVRMTSRYVHLAPDFLAAAMNRIVETKNAGHRPKER